MRIRLRTQVLLLQVAIIAVSLAIGFGIVLHRASGQVRNEYFQRAAAIAEAVAADADVRAGAQAETSARKAGHAPSAAELAKAPVQQQAAAVTARTGVLFVSIGDGVGYRLGHPNPSALGQRLSTDPSAALAGHLEFTEQTGTLGSSVRAKAPVYGDDGTVVGLVSVGVATDTVDAAARHSLYLLLGIVGIALAVGAAGSALLARRWRRLTLGLEPEEMTELIRAQEVVLHSGSDGVVAFDPDEVARVINPRARELLEVDAPTGTPLGDLGLTPRVEAIAREAADTPVAAAVDERVVLVSSRRVRRGDTDLGTVLTVVDRTDVTALTREVDSIQAMSSALRAQRHESANRMHVVTGLLQDGRTADALAYLGEVAGAGGAGVPVAGIAGLQEPHLRAFVSAKASRARERGVELRIGADTLLVGMLTRPVDATTVAGNLIDNAIDAAAEGASPDRWVEVDALRDGDTLVLAVSDSGNGFRVDDPFTEGITTHVDPTVPGGRGMGLAIVRQMARAHDGDVRVAGSDPTVVVATLPGCVVDDGT
ncbi:sensor histidine kinase [Tsukamurella sp. 8F]|uniref:sensor histidine kinase n=1 Tax=unclassified Tsukamurella TaxID=2633480 RepID=UPI0023B92A59|nr:MULTISPECIES: sensor histidine kinase [unclassified Tsukamurella]MDF0529643.1 sensor histidine kinase [Tsukamurella sp. 8J]MDF0585928.1 sensor histidine kinase [Tsukamurella sp. 8F]